MRKFLAVMGLLALERLSRSRSNSIRELQMARDDLLQEQRLLTNADEAVRYLQEQFKEFGEDMPAFRNVQRLALNLEGRPFADLSPEEQEEILRDLVERDTREWLPGESPGVFDPGPIKVGGGWAVHVTNASRRIRHEGFRRGVPYWATDSLAYSHGGQLLDRDEGGFAFASPAGEDLPSYGRSYKYGSGAVVLQLPNWLEVFHYGDDEKQLIFSTEDAVVVAAVERGRDGNYDILGEDFVYEDTPFETIEEAVEWIMDNFQQYRRPLLGREWRKAFA